MLHTFEVTEAQLARIDDFLARSYVDRPDQYIIAVQRRLYDDLCVVIVDCDPITATCLHLML